MADNFYQATVSPPLPASLFRAEELRTLETACGLGCYPDGNALYFYAETSFCEEGEDEDGRRIDCLALLREKLGQLDPGAYPHIAITGAATCSKMREGEFGGFAHYITRDRVSSVSTWQWLLEQTGAGPHPATTGDPAKETPRQPPGRFVIEHDPAISIDRVHVLVDGTFDVAIVRTDEGVAVDIYPKDDVDPVASTYAFDSEMDPGHERDLAAVAAAPATCKLAKQRYSVLLLYPDYLDDTGYETFYALVEAADAIQAVDVARRQAVAAQCVEIEDPTDFHPLLVTQGHHPSEPLFDK
jgi:hypothetical protein